MTMKPNSYIHSLNCTLSEFNSFTILLLKEYFQHPT